jgi:excisionase family DNA binding protein
MPGPYPQASVKQRFYSAREIAIIFGLTEGYVRKLMAAGELPAVRFGPTCVRVPVAAVEAFVAKSSAP